MHISCCGQTGQVSQICKFSTLYIYGTCKADTDKFNLIQLTELRMPFPGFLLVSAEHHLAFQGYLHPFNG